MCRVTVNCHCHTRTGGGWIGVAALGVLGLIAAPVIVAAVKAAVDLLTAVVIGIVVAVGIVVAGWIVKNVTVAVIEERSLRRHNERMAQIYPHLRADVDRMYRRPGRATRAIPTRQPQPIGSVRIYPTPRSELAAGRRDRGAV
jgi:hypothetical protein